MASTRVIRVSQCCDAPVEIVDQEPAWCLNCGEECEVVEEIVEGAAEDDQMQEDEPWQGYGKDSGEIPDHFD